MPCQFICKWGAGTEKQESDSGGGSPPPLYADKRQDLGDERGMEFT